MLNKNLFIRVDSGMEVGSGHMMRCFSLAESLKMKRIDVSFVSRQLPGNLCDFIERKGYKVYRLPNNNSTLEIDAKQTLEATDMHKKQPEWLVVDHYDLDKQWETIIRKHVKKIIVIDDLANRPHDCDLLIDQNLYENMDGRYSSLIPNNCQKLLGPTYALLRPEFVEKRKNLRKRDDHIHRILVSFGGSNSTNEISKVLKAIRLLDSKDLRVDVVVGISNENKKIIKQMCSNIPKTTYNHQIDNMWDFMADADLSVGGGGSSTWERCCLGLPSIVSILSKDQRELTETMAKKGYIINLGLANALSSDDYVKAIKNIDSDKLCSMSQKCLKLVDGKGASRVANNICSL